MYTFSCTHSHVHILMYTFSCTHSHVHILSCTHSHVHILIHVQLSCTHSHVHLLMYTFSCTHSHVHILMYTFSCTHSHVHILMYTYSHVHILMYTFSYTYSYHVHILMYTFSCTHSHVHILIHVQLSCTHSNTRTAPRWLSKPNNPNTRNSWCTSVGERGKLSKLNTTATVNVHLLVHTQYIHSTYTVHTQYIHSTYTVHTQYIHSTYTVHTQYIHSTYTVLHVMRALLMRQPISGVLCRAVFLCTCPLEWAVFSSIARLFCPLSTAPCASVHSVAFLSSHSQVTVPCLWHGQRPTFRTAAIRLCSWICFFM